MRRPVTSSARSAGSRQSFSSGAPFQSPFVSIGRLYGGFGSAPISVIEPSGSWSRMPFAAMSPVIPAPTIRYLVVCIWGLFSRCGIELEQGAQAFVLLRAGGAADEVGTQPGNMLVGPRPGKLELYVAVELREALVA